jgi:hypothetical protein
MNIQENIKTLNTITQKLADCIDAVKSGKLDLKKANEINKFARNSINASKEGAMMVHHHQIQREKVLIHQKEIDVKREHIELQYKKFNLNKSK